MSYSISGSGHGADKAKVKDAFGAFVAGLDAATKEGGTKFSGTLSGSEALPEGGYDSFSYSANSVRAEVAAGAGDDPEATGSLETAEDAAAAPAADVAPEATPGA